METDDIYYTSDYIRCPRCKKEIVNSSTGKRYSYPDGTAKEINSYICHKCGCRFDIITEYKATKVNVIINKPKAEE